ncbi:MAG: hypothetical protein JW867_05580, partial [Candidatus Omnitrophica bacterium]|nr:hypothetical protein [Candidatus Omnitrophota bacterium]
IRIDDSRISADAKGKIAKAKVSVRAEEDIEIDDSRIQAKAKGKIAKAQVKLKAEEDIEIDDSSIKAEAKGKYAKAQVKLQADDDIKAYGSKLIARARGKIAKSGIRFNAGDDVKVNNSIVASKAKGKFARAKTELEAGDDIYMQNSLVLSKARGRFAAASTKLQAKDNIEINSSKVKASVNRGVANLGLIAGQDISLTNSTVKSKAYKGLALSSLVAGNDISIDQDSKVTAKTDKGLSLILALAGGKIDSRGNILALSVNGYALAALIAMGDVYLANLLSKGGQANDLVALIENIAANQGFPLDIAVQYTYSSGALIGSVSGNISLGNIASDLVLVAALGGSIFDAADLLVAHSIKAHYLGMLARHNIGDLEKGAPLNTDVDIISAYSWDEGNIFINEANDIELGLYLPLYDASSAQIAALGASVAANKGIIHITSEGNMLVNSVVSPQGGVYLRSNTGSIFAGHGWCPAGYCGNQPQLRQASIQAALINMFLMDGWSQYQGPDYFTPIAVSENILNLIKTGNFSGSPYLVDGPNVIAGSYSYFSTPNGTIGVGTPLDPTGEANPLEVCIQAFPENDSRSAAPEFTYLGTPFSPVAGLTLEIGGTSADNGELFDNGDGWGALGRSGEISGIVRSPYMSGPGVVDTSLSPLNPPGRIFYSEASSDCCRPLIGAQLAAGRFQIWPPVLKQDVNGGEIFLASILRDNRIYYEYTSQFRITTGDPITGNDYYAYHPLTQTDDSAFNDISLDFNAYEFIEEKINLKKKLAPFFGSEEEQEAKPL